ncbi:MAG: aminoglycoside phosphotransferase (APT) family kinase protein [Candidatus Azotimanducaceae bacterium]|jgi:aminoglycoside phosphotransferase (APT) family kinase protein
MTHHSLHTDEIPISLDLVRTLVDNEFPEYSSLSLRQSGASGSSNILFRLSDNLVVRLPRQPDGSTAIQKEFRWLPALADQLPVAVPKLVAMGSPTNAYEQNWSIAGWLDGELLPAYQPGDSIYPGNTLMANDLADFIVALRNIEVPQEAILDKSLRWYRGRPLIEFDPWMKKTIEQCRSIKGLDLYIDVDLDLISSVWAQSLALPCATEVTTDCWYHADLVAENLLITNGKLSGVLDFGCLSIGDPTIDLHGAWEIFNPNAREAFRTRLGVSEAQWLRGRAWALAIAVGVFSYYWDSMPGRRVDRLAMARNVLSQCSNA